MTSTECSSIPGAHWKWTSRKRPISCPSCMTRGKGSSAFTAPQLRFTQWAAYGEMLGGFYDEHPWNTFEAPIVVEDATFPGMQSWKTSFVLTDEIYQLK